MATIDSIKAQLTHVNNGSNIGAFDADDEALVRYLGLNPSDPKSRAAVAVARRYELDPLLKHVVVIPSSGVYITRDGYLHIAHASGQFDGMTVVRDPELSEDGSEWVARVAVYRKDMAHPFEFPGRYPVTGQNKVYAQEMALKAAEVHALRRAFNVAGLGAADERREPSDDESSALYCEPTLEPELADVAPSDE